MAALDIGVLGYSIATFVGLGFGPLFERIKTKPFKSTDLSFGYWLPYLVISD